MQFRTFQYLLILLLGTSAFIGWTVRDIQAKNEPQTALLNHNDCRRDLKIGANK